MNIVPDGGGFLRRNAALHDLLELARRTVVDGRFTDEEAESFREWLGRNPGGVPGAEALVRVLRRVFRDDEVSEAEREALLDALREITGEGPDALPDSYGKLGS